MHTISISLKFYKIFVIAFLLIFVGVACSPALATAPAPTPIVLTVIVMQEVTREVTRMVEVPVTVTPAPTPVDTATPTPTLTASIPPTGSPSPTSTSTVQPPTLTVLVRTQCLFGPDPAYISMYDILANSPQIAIGRNQDSSWLYVQGSGHNNPCWVKAALVKLDSGSLTDPPVASPVLSPYTTLYPPPPAVSANRIGNVVTIFWLPVPMTEQDYNGYLIEAWVCQAGKLVFVPKSYVTSYDKNSSMLAVNVTDEPGCPAPSSARIYTVITNAYSAWKTVTWPPWVTPSPTPTKSPSPTLTVTPAP